MTLELIALLIGMAAAGAVCMAVLFRRDARLEPKPAPVRSRNR
jgi:hypothetical protein